jgi:hypothetical protein
MRSYIFTVEEMRRLRRWLDTGEEDDSLRVLFVRMRQRVPSGDMATLPRLRPVFLMITLLDLGVSSNRAANTLPCVIFQTQLKLTSVKYKRSDKSNLIRRNRG